AARIQRTVLEDIEHRPLLGRRAGRAGAAQSGRSGQAAPGIAAAPARLGSRANVTGCHSPGGLFYNKYISSVSAKYQLFIRSLLFEECTFFCNRLGAV